MKFSDGTEIWNSDGFFHVENFPLHYSVDEKVLQQANIFLKFHADKSSYEIYFSTRVRTIFTICIRPEDKKNLITFLENINLNISI